jgi:hypothetical protein
MNKILRTTLVAIPKGCKYIEVKHLGNIIVKPIKLKDGHTLSHIFIDEAVEIK